MHQSAKYTQDILIIFLVSRQEPASKWEASNCQKLKNLKSTITIKKLNHW